jgi:hypothetical protein
MIGAWSKKFPTIWTVPLLPDDSGEDELRLLGVFYPAGSPAVRYDAE